MAKTVVSWQAFSSFPPSLRAPRVSLAPETPLPFLFKSLPRTLKRSSQLLSVKRLRKLQNVKTRQNPNKISYPTYPKKHALYDGCMDLF